MNNFVLCCSIVFTSFCYPLSQIGILRQLQASNLKTSFLVIHSFLLSLCLFLSFFLHTFMEIVSQPAKLTGQALTFSPFVVASSFWTLFSLLEAEKRRDRWSDLVKPCHRSTSCVLILPTPANIMENIINVLPLCRNLFLFNLIFISQKFFSEINL